MRDAVTRVPIKGCLQDGDIFQEPGCWARVTVGWLRGNPRVTEDIKKEEEEEEEVEVDVEEEEEEEKQVEVLWWRLK
uniref:Uncharacterized protein n=1 Tax=Vespula pensylvanica TaxID=30213 RepID=A0A834KI06_VESPE|nr:hypothetical protein H0235_015095 [Vespula pensylvanica]